MTRYLLLGSNIQRSISPAIQNKAFEKTGIDARYELFQISDGKFDSAIKLIQSSKDIGGFNITAPYKEKILPYLSGMDAQSKAIGAVNTVKIDRSGKLRGFNTDVDGIYLSLSKLGSLKGGRCVLLGAGGAARACAYTVLNNGFDLIILNRTRRRAEDISSDLAKFFPESEILVRPLNPEQFSKEIADADLVINAVTNPFPFEVNFSGAKRSLKLFDLWYREPSSILRNAQRSKIKSIDGVLMLVEQGGKSFEIWTGKKAPRRAMLLAAKKELLKD